MSFVDTALVLRGGQRHGRSPQAQEQHAAGYSDRKAIRALHTMRTLRAPSFLRRRELDDGVRQYLTTAVHRVVLLAFEYDNGRIRQRLPQRTEATPRAIFPKRRIGFLRDGYETSFLALEGKPLEDWRNVRRIKLRFKQGLEVQ